MSKATKYLKRRWHGCKDRFPSLRLFAGFASQIRFGHGDDGELFLAARVWLANKRER